MGRSTLSNTRFQKDSANELPWRLRVSNSTSKALLRTSGLGSKVSSDSPARRGNQKYTCSFRSTNCKRFLGAALLLLLLLLLLPLLLGAPGDAASVPFECAVSPLPAAAAMLALASIAAAAASADTDGSSSCPKSCRGCGSCLCCLSCCLAKDVEDEKSSMREKRTGRCTSGCTPSGRAFTSPMEPSASFMAQNLKNAILLSATPTEWGLLVNAIRQFTQSVKVAVSVSVMWLKCSRTIFSIVSKARRTIVGSLSPAAVVKTMNMDFQPLFTLFTRASTICDRQRMMSSRISTA
mmetsp:Transcript_25816/g.70012  ORF Transcript_25816/g.70012 Transcript_25816/m.70012 type:complete len:294 (+) Transcript_25816:1780-2661(+)